jgi:signal transduction histidine kinase
VGRLFWKFFLVFWLAQVVTSVGVGTAMWFSHPDHGPEAGPGAFGGPPPAPPGYGRPPPPPEFGRMDARQPSLPGGEPPSRRLPMPLVPVVAGSIVSLLFAALLAWYFARPIRTLRTAFGAVAGGRLETRIGSTMAPRNDELADLGADFDRMADRLQNLMDAQRRLLHDVSHELRSPLARLQAAADLMRQQPARGDEFIARIERDTGRMDTLVGELLTLARLDGGMTGKLDEEVDLREIVADIADDARVEADAKGCAVEVEEDGTGFVHGSHELLYRAIENVVRNAVRHAPAGGTVVLSLHSSGGRQVVAVADGGPGVFEDDLAAIFDPFFRGSAGRSDGYGLGLAITRRVVDAHGGRVWAENRPEGGLRVTLELPAA